MVEKIESFESLDAKSRERRHRGRLVKKCIRIGIGIGIRIGIDYIENQNDRN